MPLQEPGEPAAAAPGPDAPGGPDGAAGAAGTAAGDEMAALRSENAELRRRVELAEREIGDLRADALARRSEVRSLAEQFPAAMSRHALVKGMLRDARHHPDKRGVLGRALRKLGRAPRKAARVLRERVR
jgi:hypothetical protein